MCEGAIAIESGILDLQGVPIATGNQLQNIPILESILQKNKDRTKSARIFTKQAMCTRAVALTCWLYGPTQHRGEPKGICFPMLIATAKITIVNYVTATTCKYSDII